ncbi:phosphotransferase family protein [Terrabacter sp. BE26]|uniref:phosphotransferase family protein n=1 Tax=Terrabacter sp. BE26 TaxID=2898152 RepID=UPI0035BE5575
MDEVAVVVAHHERATLRVGEVFLKVDGDQDRADREVRAMAAAPVPTAAILWRSPPVVALAALRGRAIARLGHPSSASAEAWSAAGAVVRRLHDAAVPSWPGTGLDEKMASLDAECSWLIANDVLPQDLVRRNRAIAEAARRPRPPVFMHGDLQVAHVFVDEDGAGRGNVTVTGILDWSEAGRGDGMYDIASLTLGHREHLEDVVAGYGSGVDLDAVRGWWSLRSLTAIRWLDEHGFDPFAPGCEVDVLRSQLQPH